MYIHVVEPSKPKPKRGPKTGGGRVLTPGELSFDRWHKLKKPLVKDKPTFTKFQDPQERQKLKLACSLKNFFKKPISLATSKSLRPSCLIVFFFHLVSIFVVLEDRGIL